MNNKELLNEILLENSNLEEALEGAEYTSQTEALIQMLMGNNVFLSGQRDPVNLSLLESTANS